MDSQSCSVKLWRLYGTWAQCAKPSRAVLCLALQCGVGERGSREASKLGEHRPASRWTSQMLPACNVSKPKAPASYSCSGGSVSPTFHALHDTCGNLDAESLRLFLPVRACRPNRPGSTWEVHGLEACCRKPSVQPCVVRVLIVSFALFASPPCLVTVSVQEARGTLVCHAHVSKHLSAPEIQSDRTKQPATSRQTCPSTRRDKWALAAVPGNGCRQTALCRAASCLKRDWNSSPSRLGFDPGTLPAGPLDPDISFPWVILPWVGVFADGNRMLLDVAVRPKACIQHSFAHTLQQHSH